MREAEDWGLYKIVHVDGFPRVGHFIKGREPDGAEPIDEVQAKQIDDEVDARCSIAIDRRPASRQAAVELQPVLDDIARIKELLADHAGLHDEYQKTFDDIRRKTAEAIAQMTEGIGDKPGDSNA